VRKAQGRPPGSKPAPPIAIDPEATARVSPEITEELDHAARLFDRMLSALRDPNLEDIDRMDKWSNLTLQAQQRLSNARADRMVAALAHRDRVKKLYLAIANLTSSGENQGLVKFTSIKLNEAEQLLAAEKEGNTTEPVRRRIAAGVPVAATSPPDSPKEDVPSDAVLAREGPNAQKPNNPRNQTATASAVKPAAGGMMGNMGMAGMRGMGGMTGGGIDAGSDAEAASRQIRPQIAAMAASLAANEGDPQSKAILKMLDNPISMPFAVATPFEDVLKYIKQATTAPSYAGIPIYVDPKGLKEATATLESPVSLDLEGVPLKTTLRLLLKQIGLAYCVRDGVLIISSAQGVNEELREAFNELRITHPDTVGGFDSGGNFVGGMGAMGGGMR